jgi:hypothetical protein
MKTSEYIRMVLWGFFGIRRRAAAEEEQASLKPLALVGTAIALATAFGLTLWSLAQFAVETLQ